jgi:hypothetical protein
MKLAGTLLAYAKNQFKSKNKICAGNFAVNEIRFSPLNATAPPDFGF